MTEETCAKRVGINVEEFKAMRQRMLESQKPLREFFDDI